MVGKYHWYDEEHVRHEMPIVEHEGVRVPLGYNEGHYTYSLHEIYSSAQSARSDFNTLRQHGELSDDAKYRIVRIGDWYALYIH